jgi:putative sterol carrier protein
MSTPSDIFANMQSEITTNPDKATAIDAVYQFKLTGDGACDYVVDLKAPAIREGIEDSAQCTVTMEAADFVDMVTGKVQGQQLFMMGKLLIEGDMGLALRLQQVFEATSAS